MKLINEWIERYFNHREALTLIIILLGISLFIYSFQTIVTPILLSITISYLCSLFVHQLRKLGIPQLASVLIVFTLFLSLLIWLIIWLLPLLWEELRNLLTLLPNIVASLKTTLITLHEHFPKILPPTQIESLTQQLNQGVTSLLKPIISFSFTSILNLATSIVYLVMVPLMVFFILRDEETIVKWITNLLPKKRFVLHQIWHEFRSKLQIYIRVKVTLAILSGLVSFITFEWLGLRYSTLLGFLVGLSTFIPYVGLIIITTLITIIAMFQWGISKNFWYVIFAHFIINFLEGNLLEPIFFAESMQLSPLVIILSVLLFGNLFGFWGVFLAIPLAALAHTVLKYWPNVPHHRT